jgi:nitrous oxide reductase accessory protein NosL
VNLRQWTRAGFFALAAALASCSGDGAAQSQPSRCDNCGMRIDPASGWRAGGVSNTGEAVAFDTPKCMFRYHHQHGGVGRPWAIEYYSQERRPAADLFYVLGTDLEGPMGRDLVPVEGREAAQRLMRDHHGERVLAFDEVSLEVIGALFRPSPR